MAITLRALAFVSRWFDDDTVRRVFEPLVADWQREWQDAAPAKRERVALKGLAALACAVIVSSPRIASTTIPNEVTRRVAVAMTRFIAVATAILTIPAVIDLWTWWTTGASWVRGSLFLLAVPGALALAFPFAMAAAVDAIRRFDSLPPHVTRAALLKLGSFAVFFMLIYGGWIVPAVNQASRTAMNPPGMSAPLRGVRELATLELVIDPNRATVFDPGASTMWRATAIQRELNNRAALSILPVVLIWLRWGALSWPRRARYWPLPASLATMAAFATFMALFYVGAQIEFRQIAPAGLGMWTPALGLILAGLAARSLVRLAPPTPRAPQAP